MRDINVHYPEIDIIFIEEHSRISDIVLNRVFPNGNSLFFILTEKFYADPIIQGLEITNLLVAGSGLLLSQQSSYNLNYEGSLILTNSGQEFSDSKESAMVDSIFDLFSNYDLN